MHQNQFMQNLGAFIMFFVNPPNKTIEALLRVQLLQKRDWPNFGINGVSQVEIVLDFGASPHDNLRKVSLHVKLEIINDL